MKRAIEISQALLWLAPVVAVLSAPDARSAVVPAEPDAGSVPNVVIWNEAGQKSSFWEELKNAGTGPVIVLPVYTRCTASCPMLIRKLEQEAAGMRDGASYRVVVFSFDPTENEGSLAEFRKREHVPAKWLLARSEEAEIRRLFTYFHYSILTEGVVLIHPNEIFLLDHDLQWRATLVDVAWTGTDLLRWVNRVETPGIRGWLVMHPEKLAWAGLSGMLLGVGVCVGWLMRRRPS